MKRIISILLSLITLATFSGCKADETAEKNIATMDLESYEESISVEWKYFRGAVDICSEKEYVTKGNACLKVDIENSFADHSNSIGGVQNEQLMPQFIFNVYDFGSVNIDEIAQVGVDVYNDSDRPLDIVLIMYDNASKILFSDVKTVYDGRMNYLRYNIPTLFFENFTGALYKFAFGVSDVRINEGATLYIDNVHIVKTEQSAAVVKSFRSQEILNFSEFSDMQYVMSRNINADYLTYPSVFSYISYDEGGISGTPSLRLRTLGTDGFITSTPDSYGPEKQGCGFAVTPALLRALGVSAVKEISVNVFNDSSAPRKITMQLGDNKNNAVQASLTVQAGKKSALRMRNLQNVDLSDLSYFYVMTDSWNIAEQFDLYFDSIAYAV